MYLFRPHIKIEGLTVYIFEFLSFLFTSLANTTSPSESLSFK